MLKPLDVDTRKADSGGKQLEQRDTRGFHVHGGIKFRSTISDCVFIQAC
jgi:hypothetical protein